MKVRILPKFAFQKMLSDFQERGSSPEMFDDVFFISILDPEFKEPLHQEGENYKTWWMFDLEYPIASYDPMSEEQAEEIFEFIQKNKDKKSCIVHCSMGVSRSGAVGEFVQDLFGSEPYQDFKRRNSQIVPNTHIKKLLNEQVRK